MNFEYEAVRCCRTFQEPLRDAAVSTRCQACWNPVHSGNRVVGPLIRFDVTGPANHRGDTERTFPVRVLRTAERSHRRIGPAEHIRTIVRRVNDDGSVLQGSPRLDRVPTCHRQKSLQAFRSFPDTRCGKREKFLPPKPWLSSNQRLLGSGARHSYEIKWISSLLSSAGSNRVIRFWLNLHYLYVERGSGDYLSS